MKNKNNIMIIITVTMSALAVIAVVLVTGFAKSGDRGESVISVPALGSDIISSAAESEPAPEESSAVTASESPGVDPNGSAGDGIGQKVVASASALIGVPFAENGASPSGFDNSGFIYYVLRENGYITCPRTTDAQSRMGASVSRDNLKPGDLVFFGDGTSEASFGGIYIGNGRMIACLSPGTTVREVDITTDYYTGSFTGGVSLS